MLASALLAFADDFDAHAQRRGCIERTRVAQAA
jgi:hypothetical protein